jgi:hypothetical protein
VSVALTGRLTAVPIVAVSDSEGREIAFVAAAARDAAAARKDAPRPAAIAATSIRRRNVDAIGPPGRTTTIRDERTVTRVPTIPSAAHNKLNIESLVTIDSIDHT